MKTKPICPKCASDDLCIDAAARWNLETQDWVICGTHDTVICQACQWEGETVKWIDVETKEETAV